MVKEWITFDLDGTLMQNPFVGWVFPEIDEIVKAETLRKEGIRNQLVLEHRTRMNNNQIVEAYNWDEIVRKILATKNLKLEIDIETLVKKHCEIPKIHLLEEGIVESLNRLKESGYSLAVVTNGYSKYQLPVLEKLGLQSLFEEVLTPEKAGYAKPDVKMLERFRKDHHVVAHVGDRIDHDIIFANKMNITSVFIWREMPKEIKNWMPHERQYHEDFNSLLIDKFNRETGKEIKKVAEELLPALVVHSIQELEILFQKKCNQF